MKPFGCIALLLGAVVSLPAASRWNEMDYGPFLQSSVTMPWATNGEDLAGITLKGLSIRLGTNAAVCFDTGLLRYAAGWTDRATNRWLELFGTPFDSTHRPPEKSRPRVGGELVFMTKPGPGWAKDGKFTDPRPSPFALLPAEHAKWRGLYVHGDQVVLSYTVGGVEVLEIPTVTQFEGRPAFVRSFSIGPAREEMRLTLAQVGEVRHVSGVLGNYVHGREMADGNHVVLDDLMAGLIKKPPGVVLGNEDHRIPRLVLSIAPHSRTLNFGVVVTPRMDPRTLAFSRWLDHEAIALLVNPTNLTNGGLARYPQVIVTKIQRAPDNRPYVVDTLTLPDENPWRAWMRPGGFDFFSDGHAALCTWSGDVWIVSGIDASLDRLEWRRFATGLFQPLGLRIVRDQIYVLGRDQITRLHDFNGDREADFYENFNNDCEITANFHEFASDLQTDPEGNFYFVKGAPLLGTQYWDPVGAHNGSVLRVSADGRALTRYATGLRAPNGCGVGPHGEVTCADNEGIWTPVCRLNWVKPGMFLGAVGMHHADPTPTRYDPPLCWIPWALDNSAGGQTWVTSDRWGPFTGELLHLSYGKCTLFRVLRDEAPADTTHPAPVMQGGLVKFPLRFDSGICRARFSPKDGQLYVTGLKGWQTSAARDGCFQRVRYTGQPVRDVIGMKVTPIGIELTFTTPLDPATTTDLERWNLQRWNYRWTKEYGSDLYSVTNPDQAVSKKGELKGEPMMLKSVKLSPDGKTATLEIADLRPAMQTLIQARLNTAHGQPMPLEIFGTINRVPNQ